MGCKFHARIQHGGPEDAAVVRTGHAEGKEIHNPALGELLDKLRQLAYGADDVLDELDYFRIQDELDSTYHAADAHAAGCVQDLALNARHTARACVNKLKLPVCLCPARHDRQVEGGKQGCLSGLRFCGSHEISSLPPPPAKQAVEEVHGGCMPSSACKASNIVESSNMPGSGRRLLCGAWLPSKASQRNHATQAPKLKFERVDMSTKLRDIVEHLKPICAMVSTILNLELLSSSRTSGQETTMIRAKTTPEIIEPKLYGRDSQKNIIVNEIVNGKCCELTVLPVVGLGGIGKTTFIQHIYEQMKSHFQVPIWICVSLDFNANRLAKDIVKKIPEVKNENKNCTDEELIEQRIKGKRVLLVLDDVRTHHENEWKKLLALFKREGAKGNMVIVTTRLPEVANKVKTTKCLLELERLSHEDIMSFFEECVFGDQKPWVEHLGLVEVGSKIVDKLKGSPLAAKTVGRLLRNNLTRNHWISILESKEWESQTNDNDIMPALKLSYEYLPFHLQQCFSFSALFPEDYEFGREELVHFWIGLDILHSYAQKRQGIEDVGLCFLNDLVNHGFFKMNENEDGRTYYVIHDLLHELAVKVSSYECLSIYSSNARDVHIPPSVRHLSIIVDDTDVKDKMSFEDYDVNLSALGKRFKVENVHTLMLFGDYHGSFAKTLGGLFKEATSLRIIFLSGVSYNVEDILHNFSKLVHLRYLRVKSVYYWDLCLPTALFRLYHLEVLDLQSVHRFVSSTRNLNNLVKLRHFLVPKIMCDLHSDIFGVGKLKLLQELKKFRVGKESEGFEPSQLGQLIEITGSLGIYNLENVQTKEEANELKLIQKKNVRELILEWDGQRSNENPVQEENVLESLVPHSNLQKLYINWHGGTNCPSWLCENLSVKSLESLCLDGVSWKNLPPLGELWMVNECGEEYLGCSISPPSFVNLKRLELINLSLLKKWVGNGACPLFYHLEVLSISCCSQLIELPFSHPTCGEAPDEKMAWFPRLRELFIDNCRKLVSLPPIPWQTRAPCSAQIVGAGSGIWLLSYPAYSSKESLEIVGNGDQGDGFWNHLNFSNLSDLKELYLKKIPPLPLDELQVLTSLKRIEIDSSSVLSPVQGAGHGIYQFPCEDLKISRCDSSGKELTLLLSFFPNLSKLKIQNCETITGLGVAEYAATVSGEGEIITAATSEGLLLLPSQLQEVLISDCRNVSLVSSSLHSAGGTGAGLQRLRSLRLLYVSICPEFLSSYSSPSSSSFPFPNCLQGLTLDRVGYMETLQALSNLVSLTELELVGFEGPRDEGLWPLLTHGRLTKLTVYTQTDFFAGPDPSRPHDKEEFSRASKLLDLQTRNDMGFLAAPICNLFSSTLTRLRLSFNSKVECLTKEQDEALQLLTSLQELQLYGGIKLQRLPGLRKLINLKELMISGCQVIQSLPSLPSALQKLHIENCGAMKSLPNSLPSSLEKLEISFCRAIKALPKDGLPSSVREVDILNGNNSEELKRECRKLIGTIPIIKA